MPTLQPYPFRNAAEAGIQQATPPAPPAPAPKTPDITGLLRALEELFEGLQQIPGIARFENYLYDERGITAGNPNLDIDVEGRLTRPARAGTITADSATVKVVVNGKDAITVFTGETLKLTPRTRCSSDGSS